MKNTGKAHIKQIKTFKKKQKNCFWLFFAINPKLRKAFAPIFLTECKIYCCTVSENVILFK